MATTKKTVTTNTVNKEVKEAEATQSTVDIQLLIAEALKTQQEEFAKTLKAQQEEFAKQLAEVKAEAEQAKAQASQVIDEEDFETEKNLRRKVKVKSVYHGGVGHITQSGKTLVWHNHGDILLVTIEDLINMKSSSPALLESPSLMILDKEVAEYLGLTELYDTIAQAEDLSELFKKGFEEIKEIIQRLPPDFKTDMANEVCIMSDNDEIDSGRLKRFLQQELKVDLGLKTA